MRSLKVGTRLLVFLLPSIALIMATFATIGLRERGRVLRQVAAAEARSYANSLARTLSSAQGLADRRTAAATLIQIGPPPDAFAVRVFDTSGSGWFSSRVGDSLPIIPRAALGQVIGSDTAVGLDLSDGESPMLSAVRVVRNDRGEPQAILEVAVSPEHFAVEMGQIRLRFFLATLAILVSVGLITLWLVRRTVTGPLDRLLAATRSLAKGELSTRVPGGSGLGELDELVKALNQMAGNLEQARLAVLREHNERLGLERRLRASDQLATVGRLAAALAHEIAAPLNVISGRAEMLLATAGARGDDARGLRIIVAQIRRITSILNQLLRSSRPTEPKRQQIDLQRVIDGVEEFLETELAAVGVLVERPKGEPIWIEADPDQLHQVFVNLYLNAIQSLEHAAQPRKLLVEVRLSRPSGEAELGTLVAEVAVADNGPGIADDILPRVFDPFVTTKPSGTGLGLGVAKGLVEAHGGAIRAANRPSGGAEFRVTLPALPVGEPAHA